jgi:hypothetical protein
MEKFARGRYDTLLLHTFLDDTRLQVNNIGWVGLGRKFLYMFVLNLVCHLPALLIMFAYLL